MADGTAQKCGRVGSCHIYLKNPCVYNVRVFLCVIYFGSCPRNAAHWRQVKVLSKTVEQFVGAQGLSLLLNRQQG